MNVSVYMEGYYEEIPEVWARKNKPNSKPILLGVNDGFVIPAETGYVFSRKKPSPKPAALRLPPGQKSESISSKS